MAGISEGMGLRTLLGEVDGKYLGSLEAPAILILEGIPVIIFSVHPEKIVIGHPRDGLISLDLEELQSRLGDTVRFALPRRISSSPTTRFGWHWFTPLLKV